MADRATEIQELADELAAHDAVDEAFVAKSFTDRLLVVGQLIFVWNLVSSWLEGKRIESGDPWNLNRDGVNTREWAWFARNRESQPTVADGVAETG